MVINVHLVVLTTYMEHVMADESILALKYQEMDKRNDSTNRLNEINVNFEETSNELINNNDETDDDHSKYQISANEDNHL